MSLVQRTIHVAIIVACVSAIVGGVVGYQWATGSFDPGPRSANAKALSHVPDEFRLAALTSDQKGSGKDFRSSRSIGIIDANWAEGRSGSGPRGSGPSGAPPYATPPLTDTRPTDTTGAALDTLLSYVGTTEIGDNRGPAIKKFLAHVGLNPGFAYCAAALSFCLDAPPDSISPILTQVRSATAQDFETGISVDADVAIKMGIVPQGWIHVYQKGQGPFGHSGFVQHWRGRCGLTVEANTSKGQFGNQRDGEGIWERRRCYRPHRYLHLDAFTPVIYPKSPFRHAPGTRNHPANGRGAPSPPSAFESRTWQDGDLAYNSAERNLHTFRPRDRRGRVFRGTELLSRRAEEAERGDQPDQTTPRRVQ